MCRNKAIFKDFYFSFLAIFIEFLGVFNKDIKSLKKDSPNDENLPPKKEKNLKFSWWF
jgi:hypothetical protein